MIIVRNKYFVGLVLNLVIFSSFWSSSNAQVHTIIIEEIPVSANVYTPFAQGKRCMTPNKGLGVCTHFLRCQLPEFSSDKLRFLDYFCIIDRVYVGVCCPDSYLYHMHGLNINSAGILPAIGNDLETVKDSETETPKPPQGGGGSQKNETADEMKKIVFEKRTGCGVNQNPGDFRVVGGRPADPKQWPWMVSLIRNREHFCGGVLITNSHVLTAAHCLRGLNLKTIIVRLGEHDLKRIEESRIQNFRVINAVSHKDFNVNTYENDIAILKMDRSAIFNTYAWPVCLPQSESEFAEERAVVIGWGAVEYGGPSSNVLMEVGVPVWNNTKCEDQFLQPILETNLCAGGETGRDSCQGDSGGPLLYQLPNRRWVTIGIVSWGIRCGEDRPAVYTKVSKYLQWIFRNTLN